MQDFSEAADALGSLNLSEGWSSLSLRSRHTESGAQDSQLRAERGDPFQTSTSRQDDDGEEEEQYPSPENVSTHTQPGTEPSAVFTRRSLTLKSFQ